MNLQTAFRRALCDVEETSGARASGVFGLGISGGLYLYG